ncbi:MAG: prepilin-type N-terminal cleavage/methylation domain-containing protein [Methylobacter sp.]|uniref:prepilin-type N-terminal cleavage/methylation domain-containing protein n=1 Tax=Methylobacter sp. TaxID=2051955 RepID=UPI00272F7E05|nr:prepilin-type N-terminal cleavage/methylation domain-containing protein [Methylobacter sp.]MDP1664718.1 prepilin-type N-terminal cleavage/methylation domain-containing protein [Methylobacter sp.]
MRKAQVQAGKVRIAHHVISAAPGLRYATGFTLIEVLIAMTLLSIMVVLLFSSLGICAQSWEQGENKIAEVNEVAVVSNFFQRHLSSATPLWDDFTDGDDADVSSQSGTGAAIGRDDGNAAAAGNKDKTFSFQGKKESLQFVSVFPASVGRAGMQLFSIQLQKQDKEQVIKVTLTPFFPVTEGEEWNQEEVILLRHVSDFELAYFGATDDADDAGNAGKNSWQKEWLEKDVQPKLVKINISTTNGVFWPEMIIALKVAGAETGVNAAPLEAGN